MAEPPNWLNLDHVWLPYAQMAAAPQPLPVVSAAGVRLKLADGRELIDGISSWWTACHGYGHPHIVAAVQQQAAQLSHVMFAGLAHAPAYTLAARLAAKLPGDLDHVFFSESGSVAVEIALKMALQYWRNRGEPARRKILAFRHGYHGDTFMAMAVTDPAVGMHDAFRGIVPPALLAELPRDAATSAALDALLEREAPQLAAVIIEPLVQGAGGLRLHDAATLARVRAACDRHHLLLIADEIMTGFGRTGTLFACEQAGIVPDIVCLSKALTAGTLPLAASVARRHVFAAFLGTEFERALMHGPTFMANALACAAANASLDLFDAEPRLAQVAAIEAQLARELEPCRALPGVVDVRVKGAIGVVELATPAAGLRADFIERGVWLRPFGNIVYVMPPFVIEPADLATLTAAICEVVAARSRHATHEPHGRDAHDVV
ncbi:MAG: adenosylmethionine--8-amino-7-oxononanoate transaminase [Rhodocyclaceae bacterium]|nr:adenosylmethionine--8-amino-7-oxononanoate transaminase [Rhodocyclaceae bacterium]